MGGSSTFGVGNNDEETFPFFLEKYLKEEVPRIPIEVVNAGMSGRASLQILAMLQEKIVQLKPDILLLYIGFNDWKIVRILRHPTVIERINKYFFDHSLLYLSAREKIQQILKGDINSLYYDRYVHKKAIKTLGDNAKWAQYSNNLQQIVEVCRRYKIQLMFATEAVDLQSSESADSDWHDKDLWWPVYKKGRNILMNVAAKNKIRVIDIAEYFDRINRTDLFLERDIVHLSPRGSKKLASLLAIQLGPYLTKLAATD